MPRRVQIVPVRTGHLRRRVRSTAKPTEVPVMEEAMVGRTRRRPEEVADVRRTAWKKRGLQVLSQRCKMDRGGEHREGGGAYMLKMMELARNEAIKLLKIKLARGDCRSRSSGMMGLWTNDSTQMKRGNTTAKVAREAMTKGWDQGTMFPPKF